MWLVELIDKAIDIMEANPDYKCFHLDGQTIVLEDYLEIRPERKEKLVQFLREGRLIAGPWYNLPDEWLISGESYIRNLMRGMRICRELGFDHSTFAYTPDQFGHIAALPTIMAGMGLTNGICWRGTQDSDCPAHFVWVGPDGSRMVTTKLMDKYSYNPFEHGVRYFVHPETTSDDEFKEIVDTYLSDEAARSPIPLLLMLDAVDHSEPDPKMLWIFKKLEQLYPDIEFTWEPIYKYGDELACHADKLPERHGELREPVHTPDQRAQYLIVHTISSRYPIKHRNARSQALLEKQVEPAVLLEQMSGGTALTAYVDKAWEYLMKNHPHDSICGCSIDEVHRDMMYRFDQTDQIGRRVLTKALIDITRKASAAGLPPADVQDLTEGGAAASKAPCITLFNTLPMPRRGLTTLTAIFAQDWPKKLLDGLCSGEITNRFHLVTEEGVRVPYQISCIDRNQEHRLLDNGQRAIHHANDDLYHLVADVEIPACGHVTLNVVPTDDATRTFGSLLTAPMTASNGLITFGINADGTAYLFDESTGVQFPDLFIYEDCGDSGDGWTRGILASDLVFRSPGSRVMTGIEEDGPLRTVFRVEREFELPAKMEKGTWRRSDTRRLLRVVDRMIVEKGLPGVRVHTTVENTCADHRFRVLFPTDTDSTVSFAETPFAVVERDIAIPPEAATWQERVNPEKPFTSFFGVQDDEVGLAILAPFAPHEYEVTQTDDRSLALTLFRATGKTVGTSGEPDGQLLQAMEFSYILYPFPSPFDALAAAKLVAEAQCPPTARYTSTPLPSRSFLRLVNEAAVTTALKPAEDGRGGIIRLWNPGDCSAEEIIELSCPLSGAWRCNLAEKDIEPIVLASDGAIPVSVPPRGLATIRFVWDS